VFEVVREVVLMATEKKKKKPAPPEERILAVGRYRIWVFTRDTHKKHAQELAEFHLFDIDTINYNYDQVWEEGHKKKPRHTHTHRHISIYLTSPLFHFLLYSTR